MKNSGKLLVIVFVALLLTAVGWVVVESNGNKPSAIVKKYWQFCLNEKFDEAQKFKSGASFQSPVSNSGTSAGTTAVRKDGSIVDCCYSKEIADQELKIIKIVEEKKEGLNARVIVEAEDKDKYKKTYVNCLVKLDSKWMITKVTFFDIDDSYTRDLLGIKDYCFPSKSKKQKEQ